MLFALVFTTRYLDLLTSFISLYNTTMKVRGWQGLNTEPSFPSLHTSKPLIVVIKCYELGQAESVESLTELTA